jgi:DNA-directed RNA polymerase subunit beta
MSFMQRSQRFLMNLRRKHFPSYVRMWKKPSSLSTLSSYQGYPKPGLELKLRLPFPGKEKRLCCCYSTERFYQFPQDKKWIPHFLTIQRISFQRFLKEGLIQEFSLQKKMSNATKTLEIVFNAEKYQLKPPKFTVKQAILKKETYASELYIPVQIYNAKRKVFFSTWFLLAHVPLMTKKGHFVINGSPRIIMNQIVRSPGIYFHKFGKLDQTFSYVTDIIAQRGTWLRLEADIKKGDIWAKLKNNPKLPILSFLRGLGLPIDLLNLYLDGPYTVLHPKKKALSSKCLDSNEEVLVNERLITDHFSQLVPYEDETEEDEFSLVEQNPVESSQKETKTIENLGKLFLYTKFLNKRTYNLSRSGRVKLNKTLGLTIPLTHTVLTSQDVLFACFFLLDCIAGNQATSDIDDLKNRQLKPTGELIQNQFAIGLLRFEKRIREQLKAEDSVETENPTAFLEGFPLQNSLFMDQFEEFFNSKPVDSAFREFFGTNPLSQLLDQTNPLAEMTHKRRLSCLGLDGISRETAGMAIRGIHPTHYGRICPIETPEGQNAGLVNSFTIYAHLNPQGFLETPCYSTYQGFVIPETTHLLASEHEQKIRLAPGDIPLTPFNFLPKLGPIASRQGRDFTRVSRSLVHYMGSTPLQMISVGTSLIPFLQHDDGNRALMGSNMQRQSVPTIRPNFPIVGTGMESQVVADIGVGLQAKKSGFVGYVDSQTISIYTPFLTLAKTKEARENQAKTEGKARLKEKNKKKFRFSKKRLNRSNASHLISYRHKKQGPFFGFQPITNISVCLPLLFLSSSQTGDLFQKSFQKDFLSLSFLFYWMSKKETYQTQINALKPFWDARFLPLIEKEKTNRIFFINYSKIFFNALNPSFFPVKNQLTLQNSQNCTVSTFYRNKTKGTNDDASFFPSLSDPTQLLSFLPRAFPLLSYPLQSQRRWQKKFQNRGSSSFFSTYSKKKTQDQKILPGSLSFQLQGESQPQPKKEFNERLFYSLSPTTLESRLYRFNQKTNQFAYGDKETFLVKTKSEKVIGENGYTLEPLFRTNQDTSLMHRPVVWPGQWVEKGDILADNFASCKGELAIGQNLLIGYTTWEGYNFEDALLLSERVIADDLFTSLHIERYEVDIKDTPFGREKLTNQLDEDTSYLLPNGLIKRGTWVEEGDILVGKVAPLGENAFSNYKKLLYEILEKPIGKTRNVSFRVPSNIHGRVIHVELFENQMERKKKNKKGKADGARDVSRGLGRKITNQTNQNKQTLKFSSLNDLCFPFSEYTKKDFNITQPTGVEVGVGVPFKPNLYMGPVKNVASKNLGKIHIYIAERKKLQVGDKMAGRHGNKGIISTILPSQDMPYLPDGTPLDLVLNPLGVPSRMNVGQIFECLLGLAGSYLNQTYKIKPFNETNGYEASRSLVYSKLYEAQKKTNQPWLFNPNFPGKVRLFDGRTGQCFQQPVTVGKAYMLKLIHLVDKKIHARSTGPYSAVTQQPLRGRAKKGGQRVGEMEVWALEGFGAAYILQELLTIKSDDVQGRKNVIPAILKNNPISFGTPESFKVLIQELQSLCLDLSIYEVDPFGHPKKRDILHLPMQILKTSSKSNP